MMRLPSYWRFYGGLLATTSQRSEEAGGAARGVKPSAGLMG